MTYMISYDLNKPGKNYPELYDEIQSLGSWCHPVDSTWFVVSNADAVDIRDKLMAVVDKTDAVIVTQASAPAAWDGLASDVSEWLKANL